MRVRAVFFLFASCFLTFSPAWSKQKPITAENAAELCFGDRGVQSAAEEYIAESKRVFKEQILGRTHLERPRKRCNIYYYAENGELYIWARGSLLKGYWRQNEWAVCRIFTDYAGRKKKPVTQSSVASAQNIIQLSSDSAVGDMFDLSLKDSAPGVTDHEQCGSLAEIKAMIVEPAGAENAQSVD